MMKQVMKLLNTLHIQPPAWGGGGIKWLYSIATSERTRYYILIQIKLFKIKYGYSKVISIIVLQQ
jgi:hypothetical protein